MRSHSRAVIAIGFSQRMCLPASAAAMVCSAWSWTGVATYTHSTSGSTTSSCQRRYDVRAPTSSAKAAASSPRARLTATISHDGESISAGATRLRTMSPAPIRPHLTGFKVPSELQLQGHLHLALRCAAQRARLAGQHRRDGAEGRVSELPVRVRELRMVQEVEDFETELRG